MVTRCATSHSEPVMDFFSPFLPFCPFVLFLFRLLAKLDNDAHGKAKAREGIFVFLPLHFQKKGIPAALRFDFFFLSFSLCCVHFLLLVGLTSMGVEAFYSMPCMHRSIHSVHSSLRFKQVSGEGMETGAGALQKTKETNSL